MTPFDPHIHHRRSFRLEGYDYSKPGAYFITLVAYQRACLFGSIRNGKMQLSLLGKMAQDEWLRSMGIRKEIILYEDEFIIMPNHLHGIVWLVEVDGIRPTKLVRPIDGLPINNQILQNFSVQRKPGAYHAPLRRKPRSLSSFVAGFKAAVTNRSEQELDLTRIWQRNYYDHIIRNDRDFQNIWSYIDTNIQRWQEDQLYPSMPSNFSSRE